jgi:hypothetical protein
MAWYNPFDWFRRPVQIDGEITLHCDNPQCNSPIQESPIAYNRNNQEIYHPGECGVLANAHKALKSEGVVVASVEYITLDTAVKLFRQNKLTQTRGIEKKVE